MSVASIFLIAVSCAISVDAQRTAEPVLEAKKSFEKRRDAEVEKAIVSAAGITQADDRDTRYYYNFVDLNDDETPEVLVYIFGGYFCGSGGCDAYVLSKGSDGYALINHFGPVRNPIVISENKTNGWRDLIFFNRGGGIIPGYWSVCRFDGKAYPSNPTVKTFAPILKAGARGTAYLVGDGNLKSGLPFRFER